MRHSLLVAKPRRSPGLRCCLSSPHDHDHRTRTTTRRQFIKPTRPASLTDPIRTGLHRKYEDPFSVLKTAPRDNPAVWGYYGGVRKLDLKLGVIGPLRRKGEEVLRGEKETKGADEEHEIWRRGLEGLLVGGGGRWRITEDGTGLERYFEFRSFAKAWGFMGAVAGECKARRHHPEWSNTFRTVFIRWRTHEPENHISMLDIELAGFCDEQARFFGEVMPGGGNRKPEERTGTASASPIPDGKIVSGSGASSTAATPEVTKAVAIPTELGTTINNTTIEKQSHEGQQIAPVEATEQSPPETSNDAENTPNRIDHQPKVPTTPDEQVVADPPEEKSSPEPPSQQTNPSQQPPSDEQAAINPPKEDSFPQPPPSEQSDHPRQPDHHPPKDNTSTARPLEEILKLDWQCLEETVARIRGKPCTLEEVREAARVFDELAARHQSGEYRFTRELSQERVKIEEEITDRLKFFRRANHEWRQAKKMERRLVEERGNGLQKPPVLPNGTTGEAVQSQLAEARAEEGEKKKPSSELREPRKAEAELKSQAAEAEAPEKEVDRLVLKSQNLRKSEAKPEQESDDVAVVDKKKPPDRIPWFQTILRQYRQP
ncbi:hypothetical protein QC763_304775 [Podospora pseudopauciseta]|uniref:4a-hydroxytetrahydrobiopterin dehydratase n=1 Tax=Podospora pseudopauciseta TaxID=2093780 RepID=A0ABR0HFT4_9PEZI|nr:hypothetical protein QC763_304775 [Podospora pseudopauciseta]